MHTKIALFALPILAVIAFVAPPTAGAPPVQTAPPRAERVSPQPTLKQAAKLAVKNTAVVPGEKRRLEATLTYGSGDNGVAGKSILFRIEGKNGSTVPGGVIEAGRGSTDAAGKATVILAGPELAQGAYALKASFAGDDDVGPASDEGNFGVVKGITKIDVKFIPEPQLHGASVKLTLRRTSDDKALFKEGLTVTINGKKRPWGYSGDNGPFQDTFMLRDATSWTVSATFAGDASYQATSSQGSYTMP